MCAICPKCKEIISYLQWNETKHSFGTYDLNGYEEDGNVDLNQPEIIYKCPECDEELFEEHNKAKEFLEKTDKLKEMVQEKINEGKEDGSMS